MKRVYINGIILDGTAEMKPVTDKIIYVKDGMIEKIADSGQSTEGYEVTDLKGMYIMPGLINMHAHLPSSGKPPKENAKPVNYKKLFDTFFRFRTVRMLFRHICAKAAETELMSGVTTLRTVGGISDFDGEIRDAINAGKRKGPHILAANTAVSVPTGHFAGSLATEAKTPEEAAEHVRKIAETNPNLIKLMVTGGVMDCEVVGEPGILKMPAEMVKAACDQAHELGLITAAHVESPEGVKTALANGVDTIEHGAKPDREMIDLFKEKGAAFINTISPALPYAIFDRKDSHCTEEAHINGKVVMEGCIECANACLAENIPVGLGTDSGCPFITHYDMWRELVYFVHYCHVTPEFALHTATLGNAKIAAIDDIAGSIEEGKRADFIVCAKNPLKDLSVLRRLEMVVCEGKITEKPVIKKNMICERLLDEVLLSFEKEKR